MGMADNVRDSIEELFKKGSEDAIFATIKELLNLKTGAALVTGGAAIAGAPQLAALVGALFLVHVGLSAMKNAKSRKAQDEVKKELSRLLKQLESTDSFVKESQTTHLNILLEGQYEHERMTQIGQELLGLSQQHGGDLSLLQKNVAVSQQQVQDWGNYLADRIDDLATFLDSRLTELTDKILERITERTEALRNELRALRKTVTTEMLNDWNQAILKRDFSISDAVSALPRAEVDRIWNVIWGDEEKTSVLVSGTAGVGKSGIIQQLCKRLNEEDIPFIYMRLDRLSSTQTPSQLGHQIFGQSVSPVKAVKAIAGQARSVLVVDQLDAVSDVSGQQPDFFDCVNLMVNEAKEIGNFPIVLACRKFDIENDFRLRRLVGPKGIAREISASAFTGKQVADVLKRLGFDAQALSSKQHDLLTLPLHLRLLAETTSASDPRALDFSTEQDLFDRYWDVKRKAVRDRVGDDHWIEVIDLVTDHMSKRQDLSVPRVSLDEYENTVAAMESEHVLSGDEQRVSFFHETFFDYAFARRFQGQGKDLAEFLFGSDQHLFRRAQVRQVLHRLRQLDPQQCIKVVLTLLNSTKILYHLKAAITLQFGGWADPTIEEWEVVQALVFGAAPDPDVGRSIGPILFANAAWLRLLHGQGYLLQWLDDPTKREMVLRGVLWCAISEICRDCLKHLGADVLDWYSNVFNVLHTASDTNHRPLFDVFLTLLESGGLEKLPSRDFWTIIDTLPEKNPDWTAEAIGSYFKWKLSQLPDEVSLRGEIEDAGLAGKVLEKVADSAPLPFAEVAIPFLIGVLGKYADPNRLTRFGFVSTLMWELHDYDDEEASSFNDSFFRAVEKCLCKVAEKNSDRFCEFEGLLESTSYEEAHYFLCRAYAAGAANMSDRAVDYLCQDPVRLRIDWHNDFWAVHELLLAISAKCSSTNISRLIELVSDARLPTGECQPQTQHRFRFALLAGVAERTEDQSVHSELQQLQRRLKADSPSKPVHHWGGVVSSPIPSDSAAKMTDDQWLNAIAKYDSDRDCMGANFLKGGARELSHVLKQEAIKDPKRFAKLLERFPRDVNPQYLSAILLAFADKSCLISARVALPAIRDCFNRPGKPGGRWAPQVIARFADGRIYKYALDILKWYAENDPDPCPGKTTFSNSKDLISDGINCVRGCAADAIGALIWENRHRYEFFLPTIEKLVNDESLAVRAITAHALTGMLGHDRGRAAGLLMEMVNDADDALLASHYVVNLLHYLVRTHYDELRSVLDRMLAAEEPTVREAGSRIICFAQFFAPHAEAVAKQCLKSVDINIRKGVAVVAQRNVADRTCRDFCLEALPVLFDDREEEIRREANRCFRQLEDDQLQYVMDLVPACFNSQAFRDDPSQLLWALKQTTARLPDLTCDVCERLLDLSSNEEFVGRFTDAATLSELLFRTYRQTGSSDIQERCLSLIDQSLRVGMYGIDRGLKEFDR